MRIVRQAVIYAPALAVIACGSGVEESSAQRWINAQELQMRPTALAAVPGVMDSPPAIFSAKVYDPFDPARVSVKTGKNDVVGKPGVIFPDAPISALSIVGFIAGTSNEKVAVVRQNAVYRSVRKGDRVSEQAALVREVGEQGLLLDVEGTNQWLLRQK